MKKELFMVISEGAVDEEMTRYSLYFWVSKLQKFSNIFFSIIAVSKLKKYSNIFSSIIAFKVTTKSLC